MEKEYNELKFHSLKQSDKPPTFSGPEFSDVEGIPCLNCKENCVGFLQHRWRRSCLNCKCPVWEHDIPATFIELPFARMGVVEQVPPLVSEYERAVNEGYEWFPRDLLSSQVHTYMRKLDAEKIPKLESKGANHRARQIVHQIPKQDFNTKYACSLENEKSQKSFADMKRRMVKDAIGVGAVRGAIATTGICSTCSTTVEAGDMAVFADRFDHTFTWHPQCFKCCSAAGCSDELLVDMIYFRWENKLFCARHYGEQFKPRCNGCEELIYVGEYTKAMGKAWHTDHFCCWQCDLPLTSKKYIIINNHPFCQNCHNNIIANTCYVCRTAIGPDCKDLYVKDRHFHDTCLACMECQEKLEDQTFSFVNDKPMCHQCRGIDPEKVQYCHYCAGEFELGERKVGLNSQYFHEKCFICSKCQQQIGSEKFIRKSDGRKLCTDCFKETAKVCGKCNDLIKGSNVRFEEENFHAECFVCTKCTKELGGVQFYKFEEAPYCEECYLTVHAKRCAQCYEAVEGNSRFIDYDRKYWHSDCFCCVICEKKLAGNKFVVRNGSKFCLECKEKTPLTLV